MIRLPYLLGYRLAHLTQGFRAKTKGGCHGEHLATLIQTKLTTAQILFDRGLGKAVEGIAPSKGLRKPFGMILVEFLKSALGIGAILDKPIIFELRANGSCGVLF
jgi:hypothetical protein